MRKLALNLTHKHKRKLLSIGKITAIVFLVFSALLFFVGPPIVKSFVAKKIGEEIGRKVDFGAVNINPFTLSATIRNIAIYEPGQLQEKTLAIDELYVDASLASASRFAPVINEIRITQPVVRIIRIGGNSFNFSDIVNKILAKPKSDDAPARFSLNNIHIHQGRIDYDDRVLKSRHTISDFELAIPFISNLPHDVEIFISPAFSAKVNGTPLGIKAKTKPFTTSHDSSVQINLDGLSLPTYMPFVPLQLNFKLVSALLDTRLKVDFKQSGSTQSIVLSGDASVRKLQLQEKSGVPLVQWDKLSVVLDRVEPFNNLVRLREIKLERPDLQVKRLQDGSLNLLHAFVLPSKAQKDKASNSASTTPSSQPTTAKSKTFIFSLGNAEIVNGHVDWQDATTDPTFGPAALLIKRLDASLSKFSTEGNTPALVNIKLETDAGEILSHQGSLMLNGKSLQGDLQITALQPQHLRPYFAPVFAAELADTLLDAKLPYQLTWPESGVNLVLTNASAHLRNLQMKLPKEKDSSITAKNIALDGFQFDLVKQIAVLDGIVVNAANIKIKRNAKGEIDLMAMLAGNRHATKETTANVRTSAKPSAWQASLKQLKIEQSDIHFSDAKVAPQNGGKPAVQQLSNIDLTLESIALMTEAATSTPSPLILKLSHNKRGNLNANGTLALRPFGVNLKIDSKKLSVKAFQPYFADQINAIFTNGNLSTKGKLMVQLPERRPLRASYIGSISLADIQALDKISGDDFMRWKSLYIGNINAQINTQKNPLAVSLGNIALSDFYARVIVNADGHLNLQDIATKNGQGQPTSTSLTQATPSTDNSTEVAAVESPTPTMTASANVAASNVSSTVVSAQTAGEAPAIKDASARPLIRIGQITLQGGNIYFSDNFIKPSYSANLTGLTGSVSKVESDDPTPADLVMNGKIDDDAALEIIGKINPLGTQLFLNLAAKAHGIELTRLTPYAAKYAGYPITKGKLSVDVKYHIENGQLNAKNNIFLDQLTFGEKVDSPDALKLPVLLAVALLKNSRGEIDINLPVSGSLSDPKFSLGGIIFKVFVNLITKAIISPFSLLASAFGGGDELGYVEFAPGISSLTPEALAKLATLAKALNDRPALKLEIIGRVDPVTDRDGARRVYVTQKIKAQKISSLKSDGASVNVEEVVVTPEEYPKFLERAYKAEKFSKPRNLIGLLKSLPPKEMENLMIVNAPIGQNELKALAESRALLVKRHLEEQGKVANGRMFLVTPKLTAEGIKDQGKPNRVDFTLK
ncbi:DUF748 domain-containing protein [Candidatus Nitrotoga arctica]|uniref:DUF748 domain-containing protein n=1 Tax=Candidatus Nitrotoga arctica TaxID=453162 RepID=A0ABM8YZS2_9PROT|nr:DUF748 domain-containing protein [Candidatus Nitrotoga arctica]CAG9932994.1 conserved protein of unknown function [Candidatus Nitrotoga arctica]